MEGSSPRMRGKRREAPRLLDPRGLIPAHAGKTWPRTKPQRRTGAHPRACGENVIVPSALETVPGSSPRMRGKHMKTIARLIAARLIPAHAGKTCRLPSRLLTWPAHPRACGENSFAMVPIHEPPGSSPRMRGKHFVYLLFGVFLGLIPAHAGKTVSPVKSSV